MNISRLISMVILAMGLVLCGCGAEDKVPTTAAMDTTDDLEMSQVQKVSALSGRNGYLSQGDVQLIYTAANETYSLVFENFASSNGPDLKVYLASDETATEFINLGDLKSVAGTLRYDFPASQFNMNLDTVLIWCQAAGQNFGSGALVDP